MATLKTIRFSSGGALHLNSQNVFNIQDALEEELQMTNIRRPCQSKNCTTTYLLRTVCVSCPQFNWLSQEKGNLNKTKQKLLCGESCHQTEDFVLIVIDAQNLQYIFCLLHFFALCYRRIHFPFLLAFQTQREASIKSVVFNACFIEMDVLFCFATPPVSGGAPISISFHAQLAVS